jgi:hypothetical protein
MSPEKDKFMDQMESIRPLYTEIKKIIALAENLNDGKEAYIGPINELRNCLDHLMRSLEYPDRIDHEFNEAKEHLYRAGYDMYEVLASNLGTKIIDDLRPFDSTTISRIFPQYYQVIKPDLLNIKKELADIRVHKKIDPTSNNKSFSPYLDRVAQLIEYSQTTTANIPDLIIEKEKERKAKKKRSREYIALRIVLGIFVLAVSTGSGYLWKAYVDGKGLKANPVSVPTISTDTLSPKHPI